MLWRKGAIACCLTSCTVAFVYAKQLQTDHKHCNSDLTAIAVTFYGRKSERRGKSDSLFQGKSISLPKKQQRKAGAHERKEGYCHQS